MTEQYLKKAGYSKRWTVESFFSALKRTMGSMLSARRPDQLLAEGRFKSVGLHPPPVGEPRSRRCFQQSETVSLFSILSSRASISLFRHSPLTGGE